MKILSPSEAGARLSYEQGARPLSSARGDILLRISSAIDCTVDDMIG